MGVCEGCPHREDPREHCCDNKGELFYIKLKDKKDGRRLRYETLCGLIRTEIKLLGDIEIYSRWYEDYGWPLSKREVLANNPTDKKIEEIPNRVYDKTPEEIESEYDMVEDVIKRANLTEKQKEVFIKTRYEIEIKKSALAKAWEVSRPNMTKLDKKAKSKVTEAFQGVNKNAIFG